MLIVFIFGTLFSFISYRQGWVEKKELDRNLYVNRDLYKLANEREKRIAEEEKNRIEMSGKVYPEDDAEPTASRVAYSQEDKEADTTKSSLHWKEDEKRPVSNVNGDEEDEAKF